MKSLEEIEEDLESLSTEEVAAAVRQLSRCDPVSYLQAIAALVGDDDD